MYVVLVVLLVSFGDDEYLYVCVVGYYCYDV